MGIVSSTVSLADSLTVGPKKFYDDLPFRLYQASLVSVVPNAVLATGSTARDNFVVNLTANVALLGGSYLARNTKVAGFLSDVTGVGEAWSIYAVGNVLAALTMIPYLGGIPKKKGPVTEWSDIEVPSNVINEKAIIKHEHSKGFYTTEEWFTKFAIDPRLVVGSGGQEIDIGELQVFKITGTGTVPERTVVIGKLPSMPFTATYTEKIQVIEMFTILNNPQNAAKMIRELQKKDAARKAHIPPNVDTRTDFILKLVEQFKAHSPPDIASGQGTVLYDDRELPWKKYRVTISPVDVRLPPMGLSDEIYLEMAKLLADGKTKEYMKEVVKQEKLHEPKNPF